MYDIMEEWEFRVNVISAIVYVVSLIAIMIFLALR